MTSGFVLRTRTDALSNPRVRTVGVRAAYGTVQADYFNVVGPAGSRNNPLHITAGSGPVPPKTSSAFGAGKEPPPEPSASPHQSDPRRRH